MKPFHQYLLGQSSPQFSRIPNKGFFTSQVFTRIAKIKEFHAHWRKELTNEDNWKSANVSHQFVTQNRSYRSLSAMTTSSRSVRSFKQVNRKAERLYVEGLGDSSKAYRKADAIHGRIGSNLTNCDMLYGALQRYEEAVAPRSKSVDKDVLGQLIIDIYTITGRFMKAVARSNTNNARTDVDCVLYQPYRNLNIAAANDFQALYGKDIEQCLKQQNVTMTSHGYHLDDELIKDSQKTIKYFKESQALGCKLEVSKGKLYKRDPTKGGNFKLADTTSREYGLCGPRQTNNPCYQIDHHDTNEFSKDGVTGYAMLPDRSIYATMHSANVTAGAIYHSAYSAGNAILCSGTMCIKKGILIYIDNSSGHYKPTQESLALCVEGLRASGVDLSQTKVFGFEKEYRYESQNLPAEIFLAKFRGKASGADLGGRYRATAVRIIRAVQDYEKKKGGVFSKKKHQSPETEAGLTRLKHFIGTGDDESLVRTVHRLLGDTRDKFSSGHRYEATVLVTAPDVKDATGASLGELKPLTDKRDKLFLKNRGPGLLKQLLQEAMKSFKPME